MALLELLSGLDEIGASFMGQRLDPVTVMGEQRVALVVIEAPASSTLVTPY